MKTSKEIYLRKGIILVSSIKYYLSYTFVLQFWFSENDEYSPESFCIDSGYVSSVCWFQVVDNSIICRFRENVNIEYGPSSSS